MPQTPYTQVCVVLLLVLCVHAVVVLMCIRFCILKIGIVQVNQNAVVQPNLPVGGWKNSGLGREGSLETMLEHFTHTKTVSINLA